MDRHVGVVADLIDKGDGGGGAKADGLGIVHQYGAGFIGDTADIAGDGGIFHDLLEHLDAVLYCLLWGGHKITFLY
jgi:hypothetical protein